jgi:DNA polymerase-3 subunit epsilon
MPIQIFNRLVYPFGDWSMHPMAELSHHIPARVVREYGLKDEEAIDQLNKLAGQADAICAHNGTNFDKPLWKQEAERLGLEPMGEKKIWIDTMTDVPYPEQMTTRKLVHLAAEHGFLNPFPHRAAFDVLTMLYILSKYDLTAVIQNAIAPTVKIRALATYEQRELAKARKYRWEGTSKMWWKEIKEFELEKEKAESPFGISVLERTNRTGDIDLTPFTQPAVGQPDGQERGLPQCS